MSKRPETLHVKSHYADMSAQEAVRKFLARHRRIGFVIFFVLIVCAASIIQQEPSIEAIVSYLVLCAIVSFASLILNTRNFRGLLDILSTDCNAQKMLEVASLLMEKRKGRREAPIYEVLYAMCSAQLGYDDIALQWVDKVESTPKLSMSNRLSACNVRAVVARHRHDRDEQANVRGRVVALCSGGRVSAPARRTADLIVAWIDFDIALGDGEWQRCNELLGAMSALSLTQQQKVSMEHCRAQLAEARGDIAAAREGYTFVAENGGDCYMARQSSEWLAAQEKEPEAATDTTL